MKKSGIVLLLVAAIVGHAIPAIAQPQLILGTRDSLAGQAVFLDLVLAGGEEPYAGLNAQIDLPAGMTLTGVSAGPSLPADVTIDWRSYPGAATVVAYSGMDAIGAAGGVLLKLQLRVDAGVPPAAYPLEFDANPTSAAILIRSGHALSNADGTLMVEDHGVVGGLLTVLAAAADGDGDDLPDDFEQRIADADPADGIDSPDDVDPAGDFDGDGESNLLEYTYGTDATDARSTGDPDNAYAAFDFEIYRGADQTDTGAFVPGFRGAKLACRPQGDDTFTDGTLTKPAGTSGAAAVALEVSAAGDAAGCHLEDYLSLGDLTADFVAGVYTGRLGVEAPGTGARQLRFTISVPAYTEADFPGYVRVDTPWPDAVDVSLTPLLVFDGDDWDYLEIFELNSGEMAYAHVHDGADVPADTHQMAAVDALWPLTGYLLEADVNDSGGTWLGSRTAVLFTTTAELCEGDLDGDGDVDGADLADFILNPQGVTPAGVAGAFGRSNCP